VLKTDPDWDALPPTTPVALRRLLKRCLKKDPKDRLQAIGDARIEIGELLSGAPDQGMAALAMSPAAVLWRRSVRWAVAPVLLVALAVLSFVHFREAPPPSPPEMRLDITTPPTTDPASLAISPDGQKIAFVATSEGRSRLWLRSLHAVSARPLAATDGAIFPFLVAGQPLDRLFRRQPAQTDRYCWRFAPNAGESVQPSRWRVEQRQYDPLRADGGRAFVPPIPRGWRASRRNTIISERKKSQLSGVPSRWPSLPLYVTGSPGVRGVYVGQLDGTDTRRLFDADAAAVYAPSGHVRFVRGETLFAERFDPVRLEPNGDPTLAFFVSSCFRCCLQQHEELLCGLRGLCVERDLFTTSERLRTQRRSGRTTMRVTVCSVCPQCSPW
jgi:hypothetical protein